MKAKDLLTPRFIVLCDYPNSTFKIGDVLKRIKGATNDVYDTNEHQIIGGIEINEIRKYPHIFKEMQWWENRRIEEMPSKLISLAFKDEEGFDISKQEVFHIVEWDMKHGIGYIDKEKRSVCSLPSWNPEYGYIPVD